MKVAIWVIFALLAGLWTGTVYLCVELLRWTAAMLSEGAQAGAWLDLVSNWPVPSWVLIWVDAQQIQALQMALVKLVEGLQGSWPGFTSALSWIEPLFWGVWALGMLVLLAVALFGHWLVKRQSKPAMPASAVVR